MNEIQLLDVILFYKGQQHQRDAIAYLQDNIPTPVLDKFAEIWRTPVRTEPNNGRRQINQVGLDLIKEFEGCVLEAYDDGVGVVTIGYGHTKGVQWGQQISAAEAEELLREDLAYFEEAVVRLVQVPLNDNQFAALVSFTFNVGDGALAMSTLLRFLNMGDYAEASHEFERWINGGGAPMAGLIRRRDAERSLFLS